MFAALRRERSARRCAPRSDAAEPAGQAETESDIALARHVTYVHQFKKNPDLDFEPYDPKFLKLYISQVEVVVLDA